MTLANPSVDLKSTDVSVDTEPSYLVGFMAEFDNVDDLAEAARKCRDAGFTKWDVHTPFPVHGMDEAMGIRPTVLPWLVLAGGLFGLSGGVAMQWWMNAVDYQYLISGKPIWSLPANIPVVFECTVLCAAFTATIGMFLLNKLPCLYNPLLKSERFRRVTDDRFFIVIDAADPKFDEVGTPRFLQSLKPLAIEQVVD
ncbi:MAG: DUF3341 domain-containing protein [Tepidisphaerales bacterium]